MVNIKRIVAYQFMTETDSELESKVNAWLTQYSITKPMIVDMWFNHNFFEQNGVEYSECIITYDRTADPQAVTVTIPATINVNQVT